MIKNILLIAVFALLSGCAATGQKTADMILGQWQSSVGNFPLTVTYGAGTVQVGSAAPVVYQLEGDRLTYADGGQQVRIVTFPEPGTMQQVDPITGTAHIFSRVVP